MENLEIIYLRSRSYPPASNIDPDNPLGLILLPPQIQTEKRTERKKLYPLAQIGSFQVFRRGRRKPRKKAA